ncbi:MAG TPA: GYD domain-containing protein [Xanthobacteraceae bacterium]|jgi:uncharacterized protein with GYD domain|nr:GYD domain-containing protein [Xanthobacteraceae bacterium]
MATYVMLGRYSPEGVRGISAKRTDDTQKLVRENGGDLKAAYALLGDHDLLIVAELPDTARAMQTSAALTKLLGVHFTTCPAVTAEEFDSLMGR